MKDRLLLFITGVAGAALAQLLWRHFPVATIGLIWLGLATMYWRQWRQRRILIEDRARVARRDERERLRQLQRLASTLAAVRDRRHL